ncbi:MAG: 3-phosphoglycerate dehydrogenase family protein [Thermodesulfobacteriota bacterium]
MATYRILTLNTIAAEGLTLLEPDHFAIGAGEADPHGILVRSATVDTGAYPALLAVARAGAGVNNISVDRATAEGICVFNTPGANANAVAELVFIMLGMAARHIQQGIDFCRSLAHLPDGEVSRRIEDSKAMFRGFELAGKTLGVLGLGKIGVLVANRGVQNSMRVLGFDPYPAIENIHQLSPEVDFVRSQAEVIRRADILSLHMPYSKKTHRLVNGEFLRGLRPGVVLVNYARGEVVDGDAVLAALDSGQLGGYLTDFPGSAMLHHPKVLFSPHLGASTEESEEQCAVMAVKELKDYLLYGNVSRSVNFPTAESIPAANVHTRLIMINRDVPGMIGFASQIIGAAGINIASYLNESNGTLGYNLIDLESGIGGDVLAAIAAHPDVVRVRTLRFAPEA